MTFVARFVSALLLGSVMVCVQAETPAPLRVQFDPNTPHMQVIRKLGWAEAEFGPGGVQWVGQDQSADVRVASGAEAVAQRVAGAPVKAVFVLTRVAGAHELLIVREGLIAERPAEIERIVALLEKSRKWLLAHPGDAAELLAAGSSQSVADAGRELAGRDLSVSRPGPALSAALKSGADAVHARAVDALLLDQPLRAATRRLEKVALLPGAGAD